MSDLIPEISWLFIYGILLVSLFCIASVSVIKNLTFQLLSHPKISGFVKANKIKEILKPIFTLLTFVLGGVFGYYIFKFPMPTNVMLGCISGFFSPIIYKIFLKALFIKIGIDEDLVNVDTGKIDTSMHTNKNKKEQQL